MNSYCFVQWICFVFANSVHIHIGLQSKMRELVWNICKFSVCKNVNFDINLMRLQHSAAHLWRNLNAGCGDEVKSMISRMLRICNLSKFSDFVFLCILDASLQKKLHRKNARAMISKLKDEFVLLCPMNLLRLRKLCAHSRRFAIQNARTSLKYLQILSSNPNL